MATPTNLIGSSLRRIKSYLPRSLKRAWPFRSPFEAARQETDLSPFFNRHTNELFPGFAISAKDTVLDVGSGGGGNSVFAAEAGAEVIAVDIDPESVKATRSALERVSPAARFTVHQSDSNPLPIADGRATRVLAQEVLEHVDDPTAFLAELVRAGKPGALYLITVPDAASENVLKKITPQLCWEKPYHIHIYERPVFAGMIRKAGLEVLSHDWGSFYWSMWWILVWGSHINGPLNFGSGQSRLLRMWNELWCELLKTPNGRRVRDALEDAIPKSQRILARKPG